MSANESNRRDFLKSASVVGASLGLAGSAKAANPAASSKMNPGRVIGANDRINVGVIGCGGRGSYVSNVFQRVGGEKNAQVTAVCDVYQKRLTENKNRLKVEFATLD